MKRDPNQTPDINHSDNVDAMVRVDKPVDTTDNIHDNMDSDTTLIKRYKCVCGSYHFEVIIPADYCTAVQCVKCQRYFVVHTG